MLAVAALTPRKLCKKILELILLLIEQTSLRPKQRRRGGTCAHRTKLVGLRGGVSSGISKEAAQSL
jgi:hypothetical protein